MYRLSWCHVIGSKLRLSLPSSEPPVGRSPGTRAASLATDRRWRRGQAVLAFVGEPRGKRLQAMSTFCPIGYYTTIRVVDAAICLGGAVSSFLAGYHDRWIGVELLVGSLVTFLNAASSAGARGDSSGGAVLRNSGSFETLGHGCQVMCLLFVS